MKRKLAVVVGLILSVLALNGCLPVMFLYVGAVSQEAAESSQRMTVMTKYGFYFDHEWLNVEAVGMNGEKVQDRVMGRLLVVTCPDGRFAHNRGVRVGDELIDINGNKEIVYNALPILSEAYPQYQATSKYLPAPKSMKLKRPDGTEYTVDLSGQIEGGKK